MPEKLRFDFVIETLSSDEENIFFLTPDPRRHIRITIDGQDYYRDKYLNTLVPLSEIGQNMGGLPIYHLAPAIDSASEYAAQRRSAIEQELSGGDYQAPTEMALQHRNLESDGIKELVFLSIDICGSSESRQTDPESFDKAYELLIRELGTVTGQFNGTIYKTTGDGFIAYIDHPSFTSQCDAAIDMGLTLLRVLHSSLNPSLIGAGLRPLSIRIGADYGQAKIRKISIAAVNFISEEIASDALNRAVKIEESCSPDQFKIGHSLYKLIHVQWLERAKFSKNIDGVGLPNYATYIIE